MKTLIEILFLFQLFLSGGEKNKDFRLYLLIQKSYGVINYLKYLKT
jgi:hypothetical protein